MESGRPPRLADPEIDAARREGGQQVKVFRDLIGAIVLEHDAAGPKTDPPGVAQQQAITSSGEGLAS